MDVKIWRLIDHSYPGQLNICYDLLLLLITGSLCCWRHCLVGRLESRLKTIERITDLLFLLAYHPLFIVLFKRPCESCQAQIVLAKEALRQLRFCEIQTMLHSLRRRIRSAE